MGAIRYRTFKGDPRFISISVSETTSRFGVIFLCHSCRLWSVCADVKAFFLNKSLQKLDCFLMPKDIQHRLAHFIVLHYSSTTVVLIYIIFLCGLSYASLHGCYHMPAKLGSTGWLALMELNTFCHPVVHWLWKWEYGLLRKKIIWLIIFSLLFCCTGWSSLQKAWLLLSKNNEEVLFVCRLPHRLYLWRQLKMFPVSDAWKMFRMQ